MEMNTEMEVIYQIPVDTCASWTLCAFSRDQNQGKKVNNLQERQIQRNSCSIFISVSGDHSVIQLTSLGKSQLPHHFYTF